MVTIIADRASLDRQVLGTKHGVRGYKTAADRERAIKVMSRRGIANHFVCYRDVRSEFALQFGSAAWVTGAPYVCR